MQEAKGNVNIRYIADIVLLKRFAYIAPEWKR